MTAIKGTSRSATVAFSPDAPYLAAGTMAGAVDLSFSSSASIEIFKLDFASDDRELVVVGESTSTERFNRLSWGKGPAGSEEFSLGLIAGGMVDGNIGIWNPDALIRGTGSSLVSQLTRHKGPVRGMEFNALSPNHLASGADEGDICIWDIAKPAEPTHFPPLKGSGSAAQGEISFVSWNSKAQHILASCSFNGTTVVWDLKRQKPVISFADSNRRRCSVLQWHPDTATQLIVASDDDNSPSLKLWDMRNVMTPVKEFVGHTKGVIAMSWCPVDSSYLLTCAKDNRTICWDVASGEIVSELPAGANWNFDVHWYRKIPGVISASSFDGKIGIYNVEGCSRFGVGEGDFRAAPLRAPKWYKRRAGVSFGFGGKLISFSSKDAPVGASEVYVHDLTTDHSLVSHSSEFEAAVRNGDRSSLRLLCEKKSQETESEDDRETWGFLKVMFEDDGTARTKLLTHLGFSLPTAENAAVEDDFSQEQSATVLEENIAADQGGSAGEVDTTFPSDNGEDFFNHLSTPKAETPVSNSMDKYSVEEYVPIADEMEEADEMEGTVDLSFIDSVQRALVVGDYKEAVELCLNANKMADALVIAHIGGPRLWESTLNRYLKASHMPYLKTVSATINKDLTSLVNTRPLKSWKETLAMICTFAQGEEWALLCDTLASKLMSAGNTLAATLCYICAGNIDETVEIWSRKLTSEHGGKSYVELLQDLMEKTIVFALASGQKQFSASLCKLVEKYAEILASQGLLTTAMDYLKLMGTNELSPELTILHDRISQSIEVEKEAPYATGFEDFHLQGGPAYGVDQQPYGAVDASQNYYQETAPAQFQQSAPTSGYGESYQQSFDSYGRRGYAAPSQFQPVPQHPPSSFQPMPQQPSSSFQPTPQHNPSSFQPPTQHPPSSFQPTPQPLSSFQPTPQPLSSFQPTPQPNMFVPSQAPQIPQRNFGPPSVATHSSVKGFNPTNPPALRNVEQYQQQPTLGSHLYSGTGNPNEVGPPGSGSLGTVPTQAGFIPSQKMPQVLAPTPGSRGFIPTLNSGGQRPGMGPTQPSTPTQAPQVQQPIAPPAPPPTVQTADTTNVPAQQRPVVATLTRLFNETSEALGGSRANPARKREIEDNSKKIGALFTKLNSGDISRNAAEKLVAICQALDTGDYATALQIQVQLTTSEWDECNFWLATLKRMIKTRQNTR